MTKYPCEHSFQNNGAPCPICNPPKPLTWSLSQISLFERCGLKYALQYHAKKMAAALGLRVVPVREPPNPNAQRGTDTHKAIELHLKENVPLPPDIARWGTAFSEIRRYQFFVEHQIALNRNWLPVSWESPHAWLKCVLDLKVLKPNTLGVYDWKTGKEWPEHWDQKTLYSIAALAEHPEYTQATPVHVYLDNGRQIPRTYHRDQLVAFRSQWTERADKMLSAVRELDGATAGVAMTAFPARPNSFCKSCSFSKKAGGPCAFGN